MYFLVLYSSDVERQRRKKLMDKKTQEIFFKNSVDMDVIGKLANTMVDGIKEAGKPKRIKVEIRNVGEFDPNLSIEEVIDEIDKEYVKEEIFKLDLLRAWKQDNHYVIVGVKL